MRTRCVLVSVLLSLLALGGASRGDVQTIPLSTGIPSFDVIAEGENDLVFRVAVGELKALDVQTAEGPFTRLLIPGFHSSKIVGAPELPMMNRLFEIPFGASVRVEILSVESRDVDLGAYGVTNRLIPSQPSMPKSADPSTWPFVYDAAAYASDRVAQELVATAPLGRLRAVDVGRVDVSPVEYFPAENRLRVHERIEFRLIFEGADPARGDALKARTRSPFFEPLYRRIAGYRGLHDGYPDRVGDVVTLVVITPPEFEAQLQDFVSWKTERGFHTIVGVRGSAEVGTTKEEIRDYIHGLYENGTPELPAPSFVIFVGDVEQMPTWFLSGDATDRPYCAVDTDVVPDIYYGRFSATNASQLQAILDKTLMYDRFTMPDPSYLGEVVMIAGMDGNFGQVWANGQINYGTTYYFNATHGILSYTYLYPNSGSHASEIIQHVSDGVAYVNYTAHGSETSWSDPYFGQSHVNGLQNDGEYCLAVGNCCLTSTFDYPECFAETWLRAPQKGAIGYIGGSNSTYWDEDFWWGVGYGPIVEHPEYEDNGLGAYDGLFHDHGEAMDQWYVTNDAIIFSGNLAVMESGSGLTTYYWNIYNLMGDPSISTYLGVPEANPVECPATIFTTTTSFTVEAVPGSYAGFTKDGLLLAAGTVNETGSVELEIAGPLTPGTGHLVVMAQNRVPYATDVSIIVPAMVIIDPDTIEPNVETEISVGVFESDGVTPKPGIEVWAEGLDYQTTPAVTGADGYCSFMVIYAYGPTLDIVGKDPAESWELFRAALHVNTEPLLGVGLRVETEVGLMNQFPLNLPGTLIAARLGGLPEHRLWAFLNDGDGIFTTGDSLVVVADEPGTVTGILAAEGYDLFTREFPVVEVYGTLTGHVDAAGAPGAGAVVRGLDDTGQAVFEATANLFGDFDVGDDIVCGPYTMTVDLFGYSHWEEPYFIDYGPNALDVVLTVAPNGVLSGTVTEAGTSLPLEATVSVYRNDTMALYDETSSDPGTGEYATGQLPYFDYTVIASAPQHAPDTTVVTIDAPGVEVNFELERIYVEEACRTPYLSIPDDDPAGVSDDMSFEMAAIIEEVEVYVDIDHTYQGDLVVRLTSPEGTEVTLHNRTGGGTDDIHGWYPDELTPAESLDAFIGENCEGTWTLFVSDEAYYDTGTLREWCLRITYSGEAVDVAASANAPRLALGRNVPNPFNPATQIAFDLPRPGPVRLMVFDVRGAVVTTLVDGQLDAGRHTAVWTGRDADGRPVGSGIYFYRLEAERSTLTRRMVLVK
jgi:subtilisin-like proprotein convertase family protein